MAGATACLNLLQVDVQNIEHNKVRLPPFSSSAEPSPQPVCVLFPAGGPAGYQIVTLLGSVHQSALCPVGCFAVVLPQCAFHLGMDLIEFAS